MRRNINPAPLNESPGDANSTLSHSSTVNGMANLLVNVTSTISQKTSTPTVPYPPLPPTPPNVNEEDSLNITMNCDSYWFSCRSRCTQERELGGTEERLQCFCDNSCEFFRDCCADFDQYCSTSGISAQVAWNPDGNDLWSCISAHSSFTRAAGMWMISSCPRNCTQAEIKENCSQDLHPLFDNLRDIVPVIDKKGNTYKNHYCARCHGLNLTDLTFYSFKLLCDFPVPKGYRRKDILKFLSRFCGRSTWRPPTGAARRYCHRVESNRYCWDSSLPKKVQQKCLNGSLRLVYSGGNYPRTFFNPYCALCSYIKDIKCGPGPHPSGSDGALAKPFSLVMDLDFLDLNQDLGDAPKVLGLKVTCPDQGHVYDFYLEVCRPGIAPSDVTRTSFQSREKVFVVSIWMRSKVWALDPFWPLITKDGFKEAIARKLNMNKTQISNISIGNRMGPVSTVVFNINTNPAIQKNVSAQTLQTAMSSLSIILNYVANFTFFKVVVKPFRCAIVETFHPNKYKFEGNAVKVTITGEVFQESDYYTNETEWINGTVVPVGLLTVCKQPGLNCSGNLVGLNESEYVISSNGTLYRNISRELFQPGTFLFINDTVWVCTQFSSIYEVPSTDEVARQSEAKDDIVLIVLTYVGLGLSILSMILVLVTYSLFKELRTLPGINLMNLTLALLLVHLLFLATGHVEAKVACTIIAILLHYLFLVSFMWMSIIAFETWKVFSKSRIQHRDTSRKKKCFKLLRRIMTGWLPAFVFVVVCVALDQSNAVAFHYGGIKGCWINKSTANLFFFLVPVALFITFNIIFFVLTVIAIRKTNNQARRATHEAANRKTAAVFIKIFILMGFTWIFGFLKILVSEYFEFPFIIFTTLHGLYIALAFAFTSRVKQMYHSLLCVKRSLRNASEETRL